MIESDLALLIAQNVLSMDFFGMSSAALGRYALLFIMFTMGLSLQRSDFSQLMIQPLPVSIGLIGQLVFLPMVTFLLVFLFSPTTSVALGAIILSCCPGAASSNYFAYLARGDIALSVVLTAISGIVVVFTTPILINLGLNWFAEEGQDISLPILQTMYEIFLLLVVPVIAGMVLRKVLGTKYALMLRALTSKIAFAGLLLIVILGFVAVIDYLPQLMMTFGLMALAVNIINMSAGFGLAKILSVGEKQTRSTTVEIGIQNFLLAMLISLNILKIPEFSVFAITYLFISYISGFSFIAYCRLFKDRRASEPQAI